VPSGTVIRATGNVVISGQLLAASNPNAGNGIGTSSPGCDTTGTQQVSGGTGFGIPLIARLLVSPGMNGGGVGGCAALGYGGNGGGTIVILAAGSIAINSGGSIKADGAGAFEPEYGGYPGYNGGGGIIVLASRTSITNSGTLSAQGGKGGNATTTTTGGPNGNQNMGAGGGGIINLLAPSITGAGTTNVNGGASGSSTEGNHGYAGGGGGSYGAGSSAQDVDAGTYPGGTGALFTKITLDPSTLFVPVVHLN